MKQLVTQHEIDQAFHAISKALSDAPSIMLVQHPQGTSDEPDLTVTMESKGTRQILAVRILRCGEIRHIRGALDRIFRLRGRLPDARFVLVAPYISKQGADLCFQEGVSYCDMSGNCRLILDPLFIRREGCRNAALRKRGLRMLFSPKAARILRVMMLHPYRHWRLQALADEARVSLGLVAKVKSALLEREMAVANVDGLSISAPDAVLSEWAENIGHLRPTAHDFFCFGNVAEIESSLEGACQANEITWALTSFSAAARLAPQVRYQRVTAYVDGDLKSLIKSLGLKKVSTGANLRLLVPNDDGVFYGATNINGHSIVSAIQCYLDLRGEPGRGDEAAEALLKEAIHPLWLTDQTSPPMP